MERQRGFRVILQTCLIAAALGLIMYGGLSAAREYQGYKDSLPSAPWYDGVRAEIEYVDPVVNSMRTVAWCGLDNQDISNWLWIQGGWGENKGEAAKVYWEYRPDTGPPSKKGFAGAPDLTNSIQVSKEGTNAIWKLNGSVYKTRPWSEFDGDNLCTVQFMAEMHDSPDDHTPGGVSNHCSFSVNETRRAGQGFQNASLTDEINQAANGHITKSGSNFEVWDDRD